ncbi:hypothetical protein FQR65_LT04455 [Abscondita terminalis]|nr:hypothetical protein FQR65_LT04455 [Abscondita terminalis]
MCENKRVLVIGAGFSGIDIANQIVGFAQSVYLSHWIKNESSIENIVNKPSVSCFQNDCAIFSDGSKEDIDVVIYSTGYEYKFPFLSKNCGIKTMNNWVQPLYKHIVNIQHPTMVFIGIPYLSTVFLISELQVQFALALLKKVFSLPSRQYMQSELEEYVANVKDSTGSVKHLHRLGFYQREYISDLVKTAKLSPFRPVLNDLAEYMLTNKDRLLKKQSTFEIVDDYTFVERTN